MFYARTTCGDSLLVGLSCIIAWPTVGNGIGIGIGLFTEYPKLSI